MNDGRKRLGEMLVDAGVMDSAQLEFALEFQRTHGGRLGSVLVDQRMIDENTLADTLAAQKGLVRVDLVDYPIDYEAVVLVPEHMASRERMIPIGFIGDDLAIAMADPLDIVALDEVEMMTQRKVHVFVATERQIMQAIRRYLTSHETFEDFVGGSGPEDDESQDMAEGDAVPVVRLVNRLITEAVSQGASDVHIEPMANDVIVRARVDGVLHEMVKLPRTVRAGLASRIKIMCDMDIAERRRPQDGRIRATIADRPIDLRIATLPTTHGESITIRILDQVTSPPSLDDIGIDASRLKTLQKILSGTQGAIVVSGPTGSGKSTTMYAALKRMNVLTQKIVTLEDPVEYQIEGVTQISVNPLIGLTFAAGLRQILRSDPDIVMVGEIRDRETASIAMQASLTGHVVLSSIHTIDAPATVTRLLDMQIAPFVAASALSAVVSQRLVRQLCPHCKDETYVAQDELVAFGFDPERAKALRTFGPKGCSKCFNTGYRGRTGVFEIMVLDDALRRLIARTGSAEELRSAALERGMSTLHEDALEKVAQGVTSLEEIARIGI